VVTKKGKEMTHTQFLKDNRQTVIDYYSDNVKGLYDTTLNAFMIDLMNNFRKITIVENLTRTDLFCNLSEAKSRLGLMSVEIEVSYSKPYSESNHAKQANYYGKDKANQIANS
tara:strand:- start:274 stop:612 length:339 start_codon:yes stop_codon:yes gene_type:complete